jgi:hypothetical protein
MDARIRALNLFPVKGCRGIALDSAFVAPTGLAAEADGQWIGDREWVVVDGNGRFLSQRDHPRMALIETRLTDGALRLKAPGMLTLEVPLESEGDVIRVQVWDDTVAAVTQGEVADAWFGNFLQTAARLVRFDPEGQRLARRKYTAPIDAPYKFADAFPLTFVSQASLDDLNARLARQGEAPVTIDRFRPNIVLDGIEAFEEDYLREIRVGALVLKPVKRCARCTVPGVDPATGIQSTVVPDLLATYRRTDDGVLFAVNAIVADGAGAQLAVGDTVEVELDL